MGGSRGAESREGKLLPSLRGLGTERRKHSMFITCSVEKTPQPRTGLSQPAASLETSKEISSTSVAGIPWPATDFWKVLLATATHLWAPGLLSPSRAELSGPRETTRPTKPGIPLSFLSVALQRRRLWAPPNLEGIELHGFCKELL